MQTRKTTQANTESFSRRLLVVGASEHNLKHITVSIPRNALTVITGLSGSGKSSLAFDTIYAEGQRRYVESLSSYARQFLDQMQKPDVEHIEGLSPAISIEQKSVGKNPRSTVGTVTEIYDYLRVLYATVGRPHCPICRRLLEGQTLQQIVDQVLEKLDGSRLLVQAPVVRGRKGEYSALFAEALREGFRFAMVDGELIELEDPPTLHKQRKHDISIVVDRLAIGSGIRQRLTESVEAALKKADGLVEIQPMRSPKDKPQKTGSGGSGYVVDGKPLVFSEKMACPLHGPQIVELSPRIFSFNSPYGACPSCKGIGRTMEPDENLIVPDPAKSIAEGAVAPWASLFNSKVKSDARPEDSSFSRRWILEFCKAGNIDIHRPFGKIPAAKRRLLLHGAQSSGNRRNGSQWEGVIPQIQRRLRQTTSEGAREYYLSFYSDQPCSFCNGARLKPESLSVTIQGSSISEFCSQSVDAALVFLDNIRFGKREAEVARQPVKEIRERLQFLANVGLGYLTLDRAARTLAGGESQRIRLATQIGSQLVGVLYILDEPSIGLHHRDNQRLIDTLCRLRDMGNTVIVVEHDEDTIRTADYVIDLGPGAGRLGGEVVAAGTPDEIAAATESITGDYLAGRRTIPVPSRRRTPRQGETLVIHDAREHNLKQIDVAFPLGVLTCVTGVSGSGKSTLVNDILFGQLSNHFHSSHLPVGKHGGIAGLEWIDKVISVDQTPIGRTPRSNPATYTNLFSLIRDLFARLPEANIRGYKAGRFSFNVKGGRCEHCQGDGLIKIEMHFLPEVYVQCEVCKGRRFNRETLEILYKGKSIADVLDMTVEEALAFFDGIYTIREKLQTLHDVGLGYIHLGQAATTLSGGEAQRVKLARELSKRNTGRTLYILDEPTTGLHFDDVRKLLEVLNRLVDMGNTVIVIEHNLDVIKTADWIIDLGPEGGDAGGRVLAEATPEQIAEMPNSYTGQFLRPLLRRGKKNRP